MKNLLLRDAAYKVEDVIWFQQRNAGSFFPNKKGNGPWEVYRNGFYQVSFDSAKMARAYVAACIRDGEGKLNLYAVYKP